MKNFKSKNIVVLDTSIATLNVGDEIIMDAVNMQLYDVFSSDRFIKLPTHEGIFKTGLSIIRHSDYSFVGGSNIISSYMNQYKQWKIYLWQSLLIKEKIVLMGVGRREYQGKPNLFTKLLLKNLLNRKVLHSVRDSYTEEFFKKNGFTNVINTACPTMWNLTEEHCLTIPKFKSDVVIFTLTDYNKDVEKDAFLIKVLKDNYRKIYFWVQGKDDYKYLISFDEKLIRDIEIVAPNLKSYDDFLKSTDCDYIGTRLHGGVRALQNKKRTIIIGIDNRAIEKKKDFNIKVIDRKDIYDLPNEINTSFETKITIPIESIAKWKQQFKSI